MYGHVECIRLFSVRVVGAVLVLTIGEARVAGDGDGGYEREPD